MTEPIGIDVCVAMQGPNVDLLARVFLKSLLRTCELDGPTQKLTLHIVDNGMSPEDHQLVKSILPVADSRIHWYMWYTKHIDFQYRWGPGNDDVSKNPVHNTAAVCEWMLDNCGTNKWCLISHFDLFIIQDIISVMAKLATNDHGIIGQHNPMMLVNRAAWRQCRIPFAPLSEAYYAVPERSGRHRIRHENDRRRNGHGLPMGGFDVGELFEMILPGYGWNCEAIVDELDTHVQHLRGGSGWHGNREVNDRVRSKANSIIGANGF